MISASLQEDLAAATLATSSVAIVDQVADLVAIYEDHVNICVLRRGIAEEVRQFADQSLGCRDIERVLRLPSTDLNVTELISALAVGPFAEIFAAEVRALAQIYADLTEAQHVGIRLVSTRQSLCPRFHVDRVGIRLVCTYSGPGTEYVDHLDVNRQWLGHRAGARADAESGLLRRPDAVGCMSCFQVGLLKGEAWPHNEGRGAVHRSPAVAGTAPRRVFLSIEAL